jgi:hypothetical protein
MNRFEIDYSWEERVNFLVNSIILKLYKENNQEKVIEIKNLVKKHLESS